MSDFEGVKRNAAQTFSNVVRSSSCAEKLDPQQMLLVMSALLEPLQEGQALDLTQLADYLKAEKNLTPNEIEELLVFFQSREDKLGFQVLLPVSLNNVPEARRQKIIERFNKKPKVATYSGANKEPPPGQAQPQQTVFDKRKPANKAGDQRKKLMAAGVFILLGGFFAAYQIKSLPDPPQAITLSDTSDTFDCAELKIAKTTVYCKIDRAKAMKYDAAEREKRGEAALAKLRAQKMNVSRFILIDLKAGTSFR
jgi:hypothetical protein